MEEVEVKILEIDDKKYTLLDSITTEKEVYYYFSNIQDHFDICVFKDGKDDKKDSYISLETEHEFHYALSLFYDKYAEEGMKSDE